MLLFIGSSFNIRLFYIVLFYFILKFFAPIKGTMSLFLSGKGYRVILSLYVIVMKILME